MNGKRDMEVINHAAHKGIPVRIEIDEHGESVKVWMKGEKEHWIIMPKYNQLLWIDKDLWCNQLGLESEKRPNNPLP